VAGHHTSQEEEYFLFGCLKNYLCAHLSTMRHMPCAAGAHALQRFFMQHILLKAFASLPLFMHQEYEADAEGQPLVPGLGVDEA
jgi:hypothetical protein